MTQCVFSHVGVPQGNQNVARNFRDRFINGELNSKTEQNPFYKATEWAIEKYYNNVAPFYNETLSTPELDRYIRESLQILFPKRD